ncbi:MAG: hypothetical protein V7676_06790 [Parasphingorhabdus sp.]|uniref:hypothetical protein n=1 Tax=Parasphingorhabdus sp. TaxID=2709688 RepID=UPI0030013070
MNNLDMRGEEFERNAPVWLVVRHFLSADLVHELCSAVVTRWGDGKIDIDTIGRLDVSAGDPVLASLGYQPRGQTEPLARYLRHLIQVVVWQGDQTPGLSSGSADTEPGNVGLLESALELSNRDLSTLRVEDEEGPEFASLRSIVAAMNALRMQLKDGEADVDVLESLLEEYHDSPVLPLLFKHLGDLAGDIDHWSSAELLYRRAKELLPCLQNPAWALFERSMTTIIMQSRAAAAYITHSPAVSAIMLDSLLEHRKNDDPLPMLNAGYDVLGAHMAAGNFGALGTERGSVLLAPQLISAHIPSNGLGNMVDGRFSDAHRWFWAVLRRQVALGSASLSRDTKAAFGRSLITELAKEFGSQQSTVDFLLGIRLLLESGRKRAVDAMDWDAHFIAVYVTTDLAKAAQDIANRHEGAQIERNQVLVSLLRDWLKVMPAESYEAASVLMSLLSQIAQDLPATANGGVGVGGLAMKALGEVGKKRPEFAPCVAERVAEIALVRLAENGWLSASEALRALSPFISELSPESRNTVVEHVLTMIDDLPGDQDGSLMLRSALDLLSHNQILGLTRDAGNTLGVRLARTMVRVSLDTGAENRRLLYLLRFLDPALIDDIDRHRLQTILDQLAIGASRVNSSDATDCVHALLQAPAVSGKAGVLAALDGLDKILSAASNQGHGFALADAYEPVLLLSAEHEQIAEKAGLNDADLLDRMAALEAPIVALWTRAMQDPAIFNGFQLPRPTQPNRTIVHNWAFACLDLAKVINRDRAIAQVLARAETVDALKNGITSARAVRIEADEEGFDFYAVADAPRDSFYAALGGRLVLASTFAAEQRAEAVCALVKRCLMTGPTGLDAGAFVAAIECSVHIPCSAQTDGYRARMRANTELRHALMPLFANVVVMGEDDKD